MLRTIFATLLFLGFSVNAFALNTSDVNARYEKLKNNLQFWSASSTPVYYGKVTKLKNGGYYQCIAIAFLKADDASKTIDYAFKMWPAIDSKGNAGPNGSCQYASTDRVMYYEPSQGKMWPFAPGKPVCLPENTKVHGIQTRAMDPKTLGAVFQQTPTVQTSAGNVEGTFGRVIDFGQASSKYYGRAGLMKPCAHPAIHAGVAKKAGSDLYWAGQGQGTSIIDVDIQNGVFYLKGTNGNNYQVNANDPRDLMNGEVPPNTDFHVQ